MSTNTFPRARRSTKGYDILQVEDFLEDAKRAYAAPAGTPAVLTSSDIRRTGFNLRRGGYAPAAVDAALERLEDAFAARERANRLQTAGHEAFAADIRARAQEILARVARAKRRKFKRASTFTLGYRTKEVDEFCARIVDYLQYGKPLTPDEVRTVSFRVVKGGYRESQVDALLDAVIEIMLAVR